MALLRKLPPLPLRVGGLRVVRPYISLSLSICFFRSWTSLTPNGFSLILTYFVLVSMSCIGPQEHKTGARPVLMAKSNDWLGHFWIPWGPFQSRTGKVAGVYDCCWDNIYHSIFFIKKDLEDLGFALHDCSRPCGLEALSKGLGFTFGKSDTKGYMLNAVVRA